MLRHTCALIVVMIMLRLVSSAYRSTNCLDRCEFEIRNTDALVVYAEDILSFQRFFDPARLGTAAQEVTSLHVICSKALLGETVTAFQASWAPLTNRLLRLRLQRCRIMSFAPQAFQEFQCLTSLVVDNRNEGSPFVSSHGGLRGLPSLASFALTRVRLRYIGRDLFQNASKHNLLKVYLNHNFLTKVDAYTFCGMRRLSDLDLSHNRLSGSRVDFLACIPSLYLFNISSNSIRELNKSVFSRNPMLHVLDISHNNFTSVNTLVNLVNETKSLKKLYLSGNPLACNLTSLSQLHLLATHSDIRIVDWELMLCLQNEEWVSVQDLLFPYGFRRLFRVWHVAVVVTVFLVCFCCCLGLRYHADHPEVVSQTALWQVIHRCFLGAVARRHSQGMETKLPQTNTCISILQCSEGELLAGPRYEEVISDIKQKKSITVKDVATQSPFAIKRETESSSDITNAIRAEAQEPCQSTYISYKAHLEPDSQLNTEVPECTGPQVLEGPGTSEEDLQQEEGARPPGPQESHRGERGSEEDFEADLPLSTSAGEEVQT
ncbi:uncharacterized protein LOC122260570 [Penaeus japonicus]|uniref:uncharacterized protein LOC122260570 n=1 Tax=Penaeus japonicus TaxID=27405 RepID=UPI001C716245|nr:uncharacterized protein LOC122260570 [Penaeus japonicus]